jgi:arginine decarboxylase
MIRIVLGTGYGPTPSASFDAALADANVHQYNLNLLSSVIPDGATVEPVGSAPDLGGIGNKLDVAMAKQTSKPGARAAAGIAWAREGTDGPGVFSEVHDHDVETVKSRLQSGIEKSCELRNIPDPDINREIIVAEPGSGEYASAVALAVYGESRPIRLDGSVEKSDQY